MVFFFGVWKILFKKDIKNNTCWIAQKILSKEVKQVQRGGVEVHELQGNLQKKQCELLGTLN